MTSIFRDISIHNKGGTFPTKNGTYIITISDDDTGAVIPPIFGGVDLSSPNISERIIDEDEAIDLLSLAVSYLYDFKYDGLVSNEPDDKY